MNYIKSTPRAVYCRSSGAKNRTLSDLKNATVTFIILVFLLCFLYVNSQIEVGRDYGEYTKLFDFLRNGSFSSTGEVRYEIGFSVVALMFAKVFSENLIVYILLAFFAIILKLYALSKSYIKGFGFFLIVAFYVARYFPLLEFTQLRASIGVAFILLAFIRKAHVGKDFVGFMLIGLAVSFHYSSLIFIPFFIINFVTKFLLFSVLGILLIFFIELKSLVLDALPHVFPVFSIYNESGYGEITASRLSVGLILDLLFVIAGVYFWKHTTDLMKISVLGMICGLGAYWSLLTEPMLAHRLRELSSVFILIYMIAAFNTGHRSTKRFCSFFAILSIPYHLYFYVFYNPIFVSVNQS